MKPSEFTEYELEVIKASLMAVNEFSSYMIYTEKLERRRLCWVEIKHHIQDILLKLEKHL